MIVAINLLLCFDGQKLLLYGYIDICFVLEGRWGRALREGEAYRV